MDRFEQIKNSLKNCYRVDRYLVSDIDTNELEKLAEFFIVTGNNSCIRVVDYDYGVIVVSVFDTSFIYHGQEEDSAEFINKMHDLIMIYDFCLTELRKMPLKEAYKSIWFEYKKKIDELLSTNQIIEIDFPREKKTELQQRCNYLAHAYELEWDGTISFRTCRKFSTIEELDKFVENKELKRPENKETNDKTINILARNRISGKIDPLEYIRDISNTLHRYRINMTANVKELNAVALADSKYMKEYNKALKMDKQIQKIYEKIPNSKSEVKQQKLFKTSLKLEEKLEKQSAHVMFIKD